MSDGSIAITSAPGRHLLDQQPSDGAGARAEVDDALTSMEPGQGDEPPVHLLIERVLGEFLQRELPSGHRRLSA